MATGDRQSILPLRFLSGKVKAGVLAKKIWRCDQCVGFLAMVSEPDKKNRTLRSQLHRTVLDAVPIDWQDVVQTL